MVKKIREQGVLSEDSDSVEPMPVRRTQRKVEDNSSSEALSAFLSDVSPVDKKSMLKLIGIPEKRNRILRKPNAAYGDDSLSSFSDDCHT